MHEIKPIKSGYRVMLTYNLIHTGCGGAPTLLAPNTKLEDAMLRWKTYLEASESNGPEFVLYQLSHQYPASDLSLDRMKGKDQAHLTQLQSVCERHDFIIYLGSVKRKVWGGCDG